jgi:hypothetical protein
MPEEWGGQTVPPSRCPAKKSRSSSCCSRCLLVTDIGELEGLPKRNARAPVLERKLD